MAGWFVHVGLVGDLERGPVETVGQRKRGKRKIE
jgi:hypothetical protein